MIKLMPNERVLWEGRPAWPALARDLLYVGWLGGYLALLLIWHASLNRSAGLGPLDTLLAGVPLAFMGLVVLGACAGFAWAVSRTTTYTLTTERCILRYGVALTATLHLPLRKIGAVSIAVRSGGTGDILLAMKPGTRMGFLKLWPHVRPWHFKWAQPMLRGVVDAAGVAAMLSHAAAEVSPGVLHDWPGERAAPVPVATFPDLSEAGLSAAGD